MTNMRSALLLCVCTLMFQACAQKPYLELAYQLPAPTATQAGKKVCLKVNDVRKDKELFSENAKKEFQNFTGYFNLTIVSTDEKSTQVGAYELQQLFQKTMEKRLQNMGIDVLQECSGLQPIMQVDIKRFKIDLVERKWKARVAYEVSLTPDSKNIIKESVSGNAERGRLVGSKAAEKVVGELFTDMINRLNIDRLFDQGLGKK